ncbi:MAG: preprotein translocase subunit YajC [Oscillospiraceae bacterium]|nr:preprotein translocase subunit YajC [Ruminococcus sp.]MDD7337544.1 preprotein translocase subunit YajC [Ruminococcus sp.]MDY6061950.1 preprotein translocase subunit YajC [Oscillospiraceae bacterium]
MLGQGSSSSMMWIMIVAMLAIMYFLTIRPQRKRQKEEQTMRDNIQVGDEITTIGGIMGRVVTVKEDALIIETGADKNKLKISRWAVSTNNTANEKLAAEREAAKAAQQKEKEARLEAKGKGKKKKKEDIEDKY